MPVNCVTAMAIKSFDTPDRKRRPDKAEFDLVTVNDYTVARLVLDPGWRWSGDIRQYEQTDSCQHHHLGFCISGELEIATADGLRSKIHANDTYAIPPGHDEWVVGQEPFVAVEFLGAASFGRRSSRGAHSRL
ncbi:MULTISPECIES: cupin domain-containing protein [Arthrobacter]|uniref:Cupin n=1 Tax=Arthrobacter oryzae TaxID=409290 RepID=A0A3N0C3T6_9MICC|nr:MULTISPECIES: cupin domain-containing protein [Arthrobacter]QYF90106.1 cupin domain-containing protein [Arthrobacter sp. PAMC25284]RNL57309.1 cupin [Arthrobacter oryzae]